MSCQPDFARLSGELGFACDGADSFVTLRNPFALADWTMPVVEALMLLGAVLALWLAIRRLRRDADPTTLTLWLASTLCVLLVQPPMLGTAFAHNVFAVELGYDHLPLYTVALHPAVITLAFDTVRAAGVFERRGPVVGAVCVGFVNACFYEMYDHLGPQLRWWAWNDDDALNRPMMNSVPMSSAVILAMVGPAALAFLGYVLVGGPVARGRRLGAVAVTWRAAAIGMWAAAVIVGLGTAVPLLGGRPVLQTIAFGVVIAVFVVVSAPVLFGQWRRTRHEGGTEYPTSFVRYYGALYLAVFAVLWISALPELAGAIGGTTREGTPTGNFGYVAACFTAALTCVVGASTLGGEREKATSDVTTTRA